MYFSAILIALAFLMTACTHARATETYTHDGRKGFAIRCSATRLAACAAKAGQLCGERGYDKYPVDDINVAEGGNVGEGGAMLIACK
jgi:hypothetical protein